jgi:hypothetical protein
VAGVGAAATFHGRQDRDAGHQQARECLPSVPLHSWGTRRLPSIIGRGRTAWDGGSRISRRGLIPTSSSSRSRTNWCERPGPCSSETTTTTGGFSRMRDARPSRATEQQTGDLMRTDPRGFPSWPDAVTASLRGRIH